MVLIVYLMMILLLIRYLAEIKQIICEDCNCKSRSTVSPGENLKKETKLSSKKKKSKKSKGSVKS